MAHATPTAVSLLRVYLFGRFRAESAQGPIHLPTRKIEALLAYLILHPKPHSREKLAALFWGDFSDSQARASLRNALPILRRQFGSELLLADRETVQLDPSSWLWVDALEFRRQATNFLAGSGSDPALINVELYQGDLLTDFYDDWVLAEREYYRTLYLETLLRLTQQRRAQAEYRRAIDYAGKLLSHDPANEAAYQNLMFCYLALGDRQAALKQYEICQRILRDELDVEPQPETIALYRRIKQAPASHPAPDASLTNLPIPLTSFIGRERELAEVRQRLLAKLPARLLTLTGPGGCGKTRLAIQVARDLVDSFAEGVWWVELATVADPTFVSQAIAKAIGLRETPELPLNEALINHFRSKRVLLVLDNCEHLVVACAQLAEMLLRACSTLQILATSREVLGLPGEVVWSVPSLSLPNLAQPFSVDELSRSEAVRLFMERAIAVRFDFELTAQNAPAIRQICRRLDGIPLAIELAAARVKILSPEQIAARLDGRFNLLAGGSRTALPRHQTLRATMDWSYELLEPAEQQLFRRLTVFAGGFVLEAAEMVCAEMAPSPFSSPPPSVLGVLSRLVDKSLVITDITGREGQPRYRLLETIRQYGEDRLWLSGEETALRRRHLHWFCQLAEQAEPELLGTDQIRWLDGLEREYANLNAALRWSVEGGPAEVAAGLRLGGALWRFWDLRGYIAEGRERLTRLLALPGATQDTEARAKGLFGAGMLALYQTDSPAALALFEESLKLWRELAHKQGLALVLQHLGFMAHRLGQYTAAKMRYEESLAIWREIGGQWGLAETLGLLGNLAYWEGDYARARLLQAESLSIKQQLSEKRGLAFSLWSLGKVAYAQGDYPAARSLYTEAITMMYQLEDKGGVPFVLEAFGYLALAEKQPQQAAQLLGAAEALREITGSLLPPISRADHERDVAEIRARLSIEAFAAAWAEGRAMTLDQAVTYVLQPD
jgi:predicted ATPase